VVNFCGSCGAPVAPGAVFCGRCGRPVFAAAAAAAGTPTVAASFPLAPARAGLEVPSKMGQSRPWIIAAAVGLGGMLLLGLIAYLLRPQPVHCLPLRCGEGPPRAAAPLAPPASYTSARYGYSLEYPATQAPSRNDAGSIGWSTSYNQGPGQMNISGMPTNGRSAEQIVQDIQSSKYPTAQLVYQIRLANLGYDYGSGAVYDIFNANGQSTHSRVMIVAAFKNGVTVEMDASAPFVQTSSSVDGHPNPAEMPIVHEGFFIQATQSLIWRGDPPL